MKTENVGRWFCDQQEKFEETANVGRAAEYFEINFLESP